MRRRAILLVLVVAAALVVSGGTALAVNKVCPPGTTQANPCLGTSKTTTRTGNDILLGTSGPDYIKALSGNDQIAAGSDNDTTDGGLGNDTYSYRDGWGTDTLSDSGGVDALNFAAVGNFPNPREAWLIVDLYPECGGAQNRVESTTDTHAANGGITLPLTTIIETVTGSSGWDGITTGGAANTIRPGPAGGATIQDAGGFPGNDICPQIPVSNDTYSGFAAGYGDVQIGDFGGTADKLILPVASTDAYFEALDGPCDSTPGIDSLLIATSATDQIVLQCQLREDLPEPYVNLIRIEQIVFTDGTLSIDSTTQAQSLSGASSLDAAEREKRSKAAQQSLNELKKKVGDKGILSDPLAQEANSK